MGSLIAPVLGGILYKQAGYEGVFGIGAGVLVVDLIMRFLVVEKKVAHRYDPSIKDPFRPGEGEQEDSNGREDADGENGEEEPLLGKADKEEFHIPPAQSKAVRTLPLLYCLKDLRLISALLVALVQATLFGTFDATVATESEELFGFDSLNSGLLFIPLGIFDLVVGPLAGWAVDRYGTKIVAVGGYGYLVPVLFALRAVHTGGKEQLILYCVLLGLAGIGLAAIGAPSIVEVSSLFFFGTLPRQCLRCCTTGRRRRAEIPQGEPRVLRRHWPVRTALRAELDGLQRRADAGALHSGRAARRHRVREHERRCLGHLPRHCRGVLDLDGRQAKGAEKKGLLTFVRESDGKSILHDLCITSAMTVFCALSIRAAEGGIRCCALQGFAYTLAGGSLPAWSSEVFGAGMLIGCLCIFGSWHILQWGAVESRR